MREGEGGRTELGPEDGEDGEDVAGVGEGDGGEAGAAHPGLAELHPVHLLLVRQPLQHPLTVHSPSIERLRSREPRGDHSTPRQGDPRPSATRQ